MRSRLSRSLTTLLVSLVLFTPAAYSQQIPQHGSSNTIKQAHLVANSTAFYLNATLQKFNLLTLSNGKNLVSPRSRGMTAFRAAAKGVRPYSRSLISPQPRSSRSNSIQKRTRMVEEDPIGSGPPKQIFFGIGTGRCGTLALSQLLRIQRNSKVTDESRKYGNASGCIVWEPLGGEEEIERLARARIDYLKKERAEFVGDVWSAHLPYVEAYVKYDPSIKVVILERERQKVIESFDKKTSGRNHWQTWHKGAEWKADGMWDCAFPKFNEAKSKQDAIGLYWDLYKERTDELVAQFPDNFKKWHTDVLLDDVNGSQMTMLKWLGFPKPNTRKIHSNSNSRLRGRGRIQRGGSRGRFARTTLTRMPQFQPNTARQSKTGPAVKREQQQQQQQQQQVEQQQQQREQQQQQQQQQQVGRAMKGKQPIKRSFFSYLAEEKERRK
mmetsp:Transcript_12316/g.14723  ORF Transcript_12316/g.14723 Transcript_12316/m.14723 type:complete len:439 (+) Transcript_12316:152-1468(+)|eukprot:CAMPEP_0197846142 /NCGR_PEP_ID=MMETSP1438-20131217/2944_1 /TAXON_ID=1461541 /ORGANISM="Pterosperma sp., Strain CCMP1384" /LENGTH=438 /DNA_ID=CAMNT_0043457689 /DNA_START=136 /DNA_END=1452 /DNA_ORIENTATION=+